MPIQPEDPPIDFTPWTPWSERRSVKNAHLPGIYLLARFDGEAAGRTDPLSRDIVYIGETTEGSLMGRWQQFHRAAFEGKPGHSGGLLYRETFDESDERLYVTAFVPEGLSRELRTLYILYAHRKLIWEWARRWEGSPICNRR